MLDKLIISQRAATIVSVVLAVVIIVDLLWAANHHRYPASTVIEPCALVLTRNGEVCR